MPIQALAVLWPEPEQYARFREICSDEIHDTIEDYRARVGPKLEQLAARGIPVRKVSFDPEELLAFAQANGREVDSEARAQYGAWLLLAERGGAES